ncbi:MAG: type transporter, partial [Acidimicrobiia bacterium]|nr:type transporter [Acidimicrobiia bacterium]
SVKVLAKRTDPVLTVYALVASVLAGVYFPVGLLPGWLQFISRLLPDTYVVSALRHSLMPSSHGLSGPTPAQAIVGLTIFNLVVFPFGIWLFSRALEYGRRVGVLSAY